MLCWVTVLVLAKVQLLEALDDLEAAAITVYRNPDFFSRFGEGLGYTGQVGQLRHFGEPSFFGSFDEDFFRHDSNHFDIYHPPQKANQENSDGGNDRGNDEGGGDDDDGGSDGSGGEDGDEAESESEGTEEESSKFNEEPDDENDEYPYDEEPRKRYKYPGETKKPNTGGFKVNVHFDDSPDFHHPSRDVKPSSRPKKGRGPYGHPKYDDEREDEVSENIANDDDGDEGEYHEEDLKRPAQNFGSHPENPEGRNKHVIDTKKGTREYLKHHRLPSNNELVSDGLDYQRKLKLIRPRKKYIYKISPVYSRYKITPFRRRKLKKVFIIQPHLFSVYKRRSIDDDSAYVINSELDNDYQLKSY